jgi:glycosyltransferase involved in cell wall biosynthesis
MRRRAGTFIRLLKKHGFFYTLNYSLSWLALKSTANWSNVSSSLVVYDLDSLKSGENQEPGNQYLINEVIDLKPAQDTSVKDGITDKSPYVWFVPAWTNVWGGGHFTIFRFAYLFSKKRKNIVFVYDNNGRFTPEFFKKMLESAFPSNNIDVIVDSRKIPTSSIPIATTWQSVFPLIKIFPFTMKRFYFMQDYESLFYAHGTQSMQALASYEQGLIGITGGPWLLERFRSHGGDGMNYMFTVDHNIFYPKISPPKQVKKIFFYGRPSTERRCFELGIAALKIVKEKFPDIEIVIAGLDGIGNVGFEATYLGSVALPELGELYRSCDLGLALSGTNLSYLPVELMASGIPVVTNSGPQVEWFCDHGFNCLVSQPFPTSIFEQIKILIENTQLRETLIKNGIESTSKSSWMDESAKIQNYIESHFLTD